MHLDHSRTGNASTFAFALAFILGALTAVRPCSAGLYVITPQASTTCHGGQPCTVEWLDDGSAPLLTAIGECGVALYTGKQQLVQTLDPVNVADVHALSFTPDPNAGQNSNTYYVGFISNGLSEGTGPYSGYSPFFSIDNMSGSFASPNPSDTSSPTASPSTTTNTSTPSGTATAVISTITIGTLSTSLPTLPSPTASGLLSTTASSSSGFSTATISSGSTTTSIPPPSASAMKNGSQSRSRGSGSFSATFLVLSLSGVVVALGLAAAGLW